MTTLLLTDDILIHLSDQICWFVLVLEVHNAEKLIHRADNDVCIGNLRVYAVEFERCAV